MTDFPPGYIQCCNELDRAAREWMRARPYAVIQLRQLPKEIAFIGSLFETIDLLAENDNARELLRHMDKATKGEATFLQAKAVIALLFESKPGAAT